MVCDYHVHTDFSNDSTYLMERVVQDAILKGMSELCFTDHVDYGVKHDWDSETQLVDRPKKSRMNVAYPAYVQEFRRCQQLYGNQICLKLGMEFGIQTHTCAQFEKLAAAYPFDFILLSIHQVENKEFWSQDFQRGRTQQEYNERYYQELLAVVKQYKEYSVLGHMDLIVRYDKAGIYPFEKVKPLIEGILKIVIADGKGIEVNTSSHRYGLHDLTPSKEILKLYRELGGTILTIGSDSHKPEHLGTYIQETKLLLKALGFETYCPLDQRQPIFHSLDD